MERLQQLQEICSRLDDDKRAVISPLLIEVDFMERRLAELRSLPHIRIHQKDRARQEVTPAGKQYKETMQSYLTAVKTILTALYKTDTSAADELLERLKEFET